MTEEPETVFFAVPGEFEAWLEQNGERSDQVWIRMAKKGSGIESIDWAGAVEVALCFGWIDSQSRRLDDRFYRQRFTPRRPRSVWSKVNREKIEALTAAGRMRPGGLEQVEAAKADGRWEAAYDGAATATVPDDLAMALEEAGLTEAFGRLDSANRYAILHRIQTVRRPETRARNIEKFVAAIGSGELPHPQARRDRD